MTSRFFLKVRSFFTKDTVFLAGLFFLILALFKTAFKFNFFNDDFYLLRISHPTGLSDILHFFYPLKSYGFYRPISIEIFYSFINYFSRTPFLGYILSFATYFVGLTFLYFSLKIVFPQKIFLTRSATFIYAIHFTHVFQLLWLAAYQEIALFTFLCAAFFFALRKSVKSFFVCYLIALMSREQAVLLPLFLLIFFLSKKTWRERRPILVGSFLIAAAFFVIYILNYRVLAVREEYAFHPTPKLIVNNLFWYAMWAIGFPNILPDYFPSIFGPPIKEFGRYLADTSFILYLGGLGTYLFVLGGSVIIGIRSHLYRARFAKIFLIIVVGFLIFVLPALPIIHRWMLRLTVPLIFTSVIQGWIIYEVGIRKKIVARLLLILFFSWNFLAITFHETSSTYLLESKITGRVEKIIRANRDEIIYKGNIYFFDRTSVKNGWVGSKKVKLSLSDQSFLSYFLPGSSVTAFYGFENPEKLEKSFIVDANELIK